MPARLQTEVPVDGRRRAARWLVIAPLLLAIPMLGLGLAPAFEGEVTVGRLYLGATQRADSEGDWPQGFTTMTVNKGRSRIWYLRIGDWRWGAWLEEVSVDLLQRLVP